jgi:putative phosphoribosyl transferase
MTTISYDRPIDRTVRIQADAVCIEGDWTMPIAATGVVIFAQGSGGSRFSRRSRMVAQKLYDENFGTLLLDLLTADEEREDALTAALRFDAKFLAERLTAAARWLKDQPETRDLPIGLFGTNTGAAAALLCAAETPGLVDAVVSRGGRPDLADIALRKVTAPTLLIVGGEDVGILRLNQWAYWRLNCERHLEIVPGSSHLFEETGALDKATLLTAEWFELHLGSTSHQWW